MAVVSKRSRSDVPSSADGLDPAVLRGMYRAMLLTRAIEERGHALYRHPTWIQSASVWGVYGVG